MRWGWLLASLVSWRFPDPGTEGKKTGGRVNRPRIASDHNVQRRWVGAIVDRIRWGSRLENRRDCIGR